MQEPEQSLNQEAVADDARLPTPEEIARLDAEYVPFRGFDTWRESVPDETSWTRALGLLEERRSKAPSDALEAAVRGAMQAAANDTGALEGLYEAERGLTYSLATQARIRERELR